MTHEYSANDEQDHGPEHDHRLPDATSIPVTEEPQPAEVLLADTEV